MSESQDERGGFILYLSQQALPIRILAFVVFVVAVIALIIALTVGLYFFNVNNYPRKIPFALAEDVTVAEYVVFEDTEAYPAALATHEGTLYTGSYAHGTVWRINPNGDLSEVPTSRDQIGSVIGLDVSSDGTVYVLDHIDPLTNGGAIIWQIVDNTLTQVAQWEAHNPNDLAVTDDGRVFVVDVNVGHIMLIEAGAPRIWWQAPDEQMEIAGLAYDAAHNRLLASDALQTAIYAFPLDTGANDTDAVEASREILYQDDNAQSLPYFNGLDMSADGRLFVAALGLNEIWTLDLAAQEFTILGANYRGGSDVAYDETSGRLFVNNWDQNWLLPISFIGMDMTLAPRLPFSVDMISW